MSSTTTRKTLTLTIDADFLIGHAFLQRARNELKRGRLDLERITRCLSMAADMLPVPPISTEEIRSQGDARRVIASMETRVSMMPEAQVLGILGAVRRTASS